MLSNLQSIFSPNAPAPPSPFASYLFDQMNLGAFGQQLQSDLFAPTYYIRVIPWEGNGPVGKVSNTIAITYKPIEQKPLPIIAEQPAIFDLKIVRFTGEQNINPDLFGCVTIVSVDEAKLRAALNANISLVVGAEMAKVLEYWDRLGFEELTAQTKAQAIDAAVADAKAKAASGYVQCPSAAPAPEEGGFWGDLWGAIKSSWDLVVETFNQLKGGIVYLMAKFVVEPFTGSCEQTCQDRLMTGLNLAVTYFTGIPPNLPTTDQLIDDGLNYAVNAALEESGVECGGLCKWNIEQGLKATADALKQAGSQPACFPGGENTAR